LKKQGKFCGLTVLLLHLSQ